MHTKLKLTATTCLKTLTVGGLLSSSAVAQHVHGIVNVGIVVEEQELAVSLEAPLSDVVGFERAPETVAETEQLRAIASVLWDADAMFGTPQAAGCNARDAEIEAPAYLVALRETEDGHQSTGAAEHADETDHEEHDDHAEESHGGHADHDDHDEHHEHADHDHDEHGEEAHAEHAEHDDHSDDAHADHEEHGDHAEVNAQYVWECSNPQALDALAAHFAKEFKNLETVNVQIVTAAGARVLETDGQVEAISLVAP